MCFLHGSCCVNILSMLQQQARNDLDAGNSAKTCRCFDLDTACSVVILFAVA